MNKTKLRITGISLFMSNIISYITGFLFSIAISRRLDEIDFGAWSYIGILIGYALLPTQLTYEWITRDVARGKQVATSAIASSIPFILLSTLIYFILSFTLASPVSLNPSVLLLGYLQLIPLYFATLIRKITSGYSPQHLGIGNIIFELSKLILAFYLVVELKLNLFGVFTSIGIAYIMQSIYLIFIIRGTFIKSIDKTIIFKWYKGIPFKFIDQLTSLLNGLDILILSMFIGTTLVTGYWQAVLIIGTMMKSTSYLAGGLYPRLLSGGTQKDIDRSYFVTATLSLPIAVALIVMSDGILWILRPSYSIVWPAAAILTISYLIWVLLVYYLEVIITGVDRFDVNDNLNISAYNKSNVFLVKNIRLITKVIHIILTLLVLITYNILKLNIVLLLMGFSLVHLISNIIHLMFLKSFVMKKNNHLHINLNLLYHNIIATMIMASTILFMRYYLPLQLTTVIISMFNILVYILLGFTSYLLFLLAFSDDFKSLLKDIRLFLTNM